MIKYDTWKENICAFPNYFENLKIDITFVFIHSSIQYSVWWQIQSLLQNDSST